MRKIYSLLAAFLFITSLYIIACDGGGDEGDNGEVEEPGLSPPAPTANFGSIRGRVRSANGSPLNAVHVRAVNINNTDIQISSFSGIASNRTIVNGLFQIDRIPPGNYRVLIERLDARSGVFNDIIYSDFVEDQNPFIAFPDEYYNGNDESSTDDPEDFVVITVNAGFISTGVNFITNN
ncbi:MAG: carboxypeptidase-like regulatory domain-containing protein [Thermodesulfobacteriota bacterium]